MFCTEVKKSIKGTCKYAIIRYRSESVIVTCKICDQTSLTHYFSVFCVYCFVVNIVNLP